MIRISFALFSSMENPMTNDSSVGQLIITLSKLCFVKQLIDLPVFNKITFYNKLQKYIFLKTHTNIYLNMSFKVKKYFFHFFYHRTSNFSK